MLMSILLSLSQVKEHEDSSWCLIWHVHNIYWRNFYSNINMQFLLAHHIAALASRREDFYYITLNVRYEILCLIILYWVTALLSVIYACIELNKKGISSEVRSLILKRHCLTIVFFICASSYVLFGSVIVLHFRKDGK